MNIRNSVVTSVSPFQVQMDSLHSKFCLGMKTPPSISPMTLGCLQSQEILTLNKDKCIGLP